MGSGEVAPPALRASLPFRCERSDWSRGCSLLGPVSRCRIQLIVAEEQAGMFTAPRRNVVDSATRHLRPRLR